MNYMLFILNLSDTNALDKLHQSIGENNQQLDGNHGQSTPPTYGKIITVDKDFRFGKVSTDHWLPLEGINVDQLKGEDEDHVSDRPQISTDEITCLTQCLLSVSDSIPYAGVSVRVLLFHPNLSSDSEDPSDSYLSLYGAIKKLSCWHNAEIVVVSADGGVGGCLQELVDFTGASVTSDVSTLHKGAAVWRGKIAVLQKLGGSGQVLPGFQLECDPTSQDAFNDRLRSLYCGTRKQSDTTRIPVLGRILEVLDQVDCRTIPAFLLTSHTLSLSAWHRCDASEALMQIFQDLDQNAVIARLAVYHPDSVRDCRRKLSTQAWKESLIAHIDYIEEKEEDLTAPVSFMSVAVTSDCHLSGGVCVTVLRDGSEIHPYVFLSEGSVPPLTVCPESDDNVAMLLGSLPQTSGELLNQIHGGLTALQTTALHHWIDEVEARGNAAVMSSGTLLQFLGKVQERFLPQLLQEGMMDASVCKSEHDVKLPTLESDLSMEPADWPERLALQHLDCQKRGPRHYESAENRKLSSLHTDTGACATIEVNDFLKLFKPNGAAFQEKLSPIRQHSKRTLSKMSSQGETKLQWPDCKETMFHGIDYYKDRVSELNEEHYWSLREKFLQQETCSSFTTKHLLTRKKPVASRGRRLMSPNRKSPRQQQSSSSQILGTAESSRQLMMQHSRLKSPRKRHRLRSPRKQPSSSFQRLSSCDHALPPPPRRKRDTRSQDAPSLRDSTRVELDSANIAAAAAAEAQKKQSRSERHKKALEGVVKRVLLAHQVKEEDHMFKLCFTKLFQVSKFFVKALPNSRNLSQEMKSIAEGQVTQVVDLMRRRLEMKSKK